jgi:hypothetical protein
MMMGFGEILLLAVLSGGTANSDLVTLIEPTHYFQSRKIDISIAKAIELAGTDPKDARTQVMQLTALRYLAAESEKLKKTPMYVAHRQTLEEIALGKRAPDALGFAEDYARRVLRKLDGSKPPAPKLLPIREDSLSWFPADTNFAYVFDLQRTRETGLADDPLKEMLKRMPEDVKKVLYDQIEQAGNIRVERLAFGMVENAKNRDQRKMLIRVTGKANQAWAAKALKKLNPKFELKQIKDEKGTPITLAQQPNRAPIIALVGNTEVLIVGYQGDKEKHEEVFEEALAIRLGKQRSAGTGVLKDPLAKVPDKAVAFMAFDGSGDYFNFAKSVFDPVPGKMLVHIERAPKGLDVKLHASLTNEEEAGKLVEHVSALRKKSIAALQKAMQFPQPAGEPAIPYQALINFADSVQVQNQADRVQMRVVVSDGLIQQLAAAAMHASFRSSPPPPVKKIEKD